MNLAKKLRKIPADSFLRRCRTAYSRSFREKSRTVQENATGNSRRGNRKLQGEIRTAYIRYNLSPEDYRSFNLYGKTKKQIREYISKTEARHLFLNKTMNRLPHEKYERYQLFSGFYHREIIRVDGEKDKKAFLDLNKENGIVIKPIAGTKGHGIRIYPGENIPDPETLFQEMSFPAIIEQRIVQGEELARFHPVSVNTVRLVTALCAGRFTVLFALLRTGKGNTAVDNVGSGGLVCRIDLNTGMIDTDAICANERYKVHPDTGVQFAGSVIPEWRQLLQLTEQAHRSFPVQELIGWDYAWTDKGWDLVEANPNPSFGSWQALSGKGIRPMLANAGLLK